MRKMLRALAVAILLSYAMTAYAFSVRPIEHLPVVRYCQMPDAPPLFWTCRHVVRFYHT